MSNPNVKILPTHVFDNFNLWGKTNCHGNMSQNGEQNFGKISG